MDAPRTLVSVLQAIDQMGYDSRKIISGVACVKSFRETERRLKRECKMLESQSAQYREILPICREIVSFGIGLPELMAVHAAVMKKVDMENISYSEAAYALMNDIDTPGKKAEMQMELNDIIIKIQMTNLVLARRNDAVTALVKLQYYGITENQIMNLCRVIEANGHELSGPRSMNSQTFPVS